MSYKIIDSILKETRDEYPDFYEQEKSWWQTFKNNFVAKSDIFRLDQLEKLPKEISIINKYFKNLDVDVRLSRSTDLNAFTLPAIESDDPSITNLSMIRFVNKGFRKLMLTPLNKVKKGFKPGEVIFPKSEIKFLIFVTKGTLVNLTPVERLAIYLHEIGHWYTTSKHVPFHLRALWSEESKAYAGINITQYLAAYSLFLSRYNEYESDLFAIHAGYGKELASGFQKMTTIDRPHATRTIRAADKAVRQFLQWQNQMEDSGEPAMVDGEDYSADVSSYPSMRTRIKQTHRYDSDKKYRKKADKYIEQDYTDIYD